MTPVMFEDDIFAVGWLTTPWSSREPPYHGAIWKYIRTLPIRISYRPTLQTESIAYNLVYFKTVRVRYPLKQKRHYEVWEPKPFREEFWLTPADSEMTINSLMEIRTFSPSTWLLYTMFGPDYSWAEYEDYLQKQLYAGLV